MKGPVYLDTADYIILSIMLSVSVAISIFFATRDRNKTTRLEYLLGGRQMSALPVCLSLFATFQSAISLLGFPAEVYAYGTMKLYVIVGFALSYLLFFSTAVPLLYPLKLTSVYEYLLLRFKSRTVRLLGAVVGVVTTISFMTTALLSPALAMETAVGIPLWVSIVIIGVIGTLYTTFGGIKSVIWSDVFQTLVIMTGIFCVLIQICMDSGGVGAVWKEVIASERLDFDNISLDPRVRHTVWGVCFGGMWLYLASHFTQNSVQRMVSIKSLRQAKIAYLILMPVTCGYFVFLIMTGLAMVAYFRLERCDPIEAKYVNNENQLMPYLVMHTLRFLPGLPGLYISTIFSAALSTLSSGINSLAANMVEDFFAGFLRGKSEYVITLITKAFVCFFGVIVISFAYLAKSFDGPLTQINYTAIGASNGPLLGLFLLGGLFPQANHIGAITGCVVGFITSVTLAVGGTLFGYKTQKLAAGPSDSCGVDVLTIPGWNMTETLTKPMISIFGFNVSSSLDLLNSVMSTWNSINVGDDIAPTFLSNASYFIYGLTPSSTSSSILKHAVNLEDKPFSFFDLSYVWNPMIGAGITVIIGIAVSLISNPFIEYQAMPESKLLFPFCRNFWYSKKGLEMELQETDEALNNEPA